MQVSKKFKSLDKKTQSKILCDTLTIDNIVSLYKILGPSIRNCKAFEDLQRDDWVKLIHNSVLPEDFILEFQEELKKKYFLDTEIFRYQKVSEDFIRENLDNVNWFYISQYQDLSENFIREFKDKVYWPYISEYQNLSKAFIKEFKDRLTPEYIARHQKVSSNQLRNLGLDEEVLYEKLLSNKKISTKTKIKFKPASGNTKSYDLNGATLTIFPDKTYELIIKRGEKLEIHNGKFIKLMKRLTGKTIHNYVILMKLKRDKYRVFVRIADFGLHSYDFTTSENITNLYAPEYIQDEFYLKSKKYYYFPFFGVKASIKEVEKCGIKLDRYNMQDSISEIIYRVKGGIKIPIYNRIRW